jgi:hypothetical protein
MPAGVSVDDIHGEERKLTSRGAVSVINYSRVARDGELDDEVGVVGKFVDEF